MKQQVIGFFTKDDKVRPITAPAQPLVIVRKPNRLLHLETIFKGEEIDEEIKKSAIENLNHLEKELEKYYGRALRNITIITYKSQEAFKRKFGKGWSADTTAFVNGWVTDDGKIEIKIHFPPSTINFLEGGIEYFEDWDRYRALIHEVGHAASPMNHSAQPWVKSLRESFLEEGSCDLVAWRFAFNKLDYPESLDETLQERGEVTPSYYNEIYLTILLALIVTGEAKNPYAKGATEKAFKWIESIRKANVKEFHRIIVPALYTLKKEGIDTEWLFKAKAEDKHALEERIASISKKWNLSDADLEEMWYAMFTGFAPERPPTEEEQKTQMTRMRAAREREWKRAKEHKAKPLTKEEIAERRRISARMGG